jgi:hypothetical protein
MQTERAILEKKPLYAVLFTTTDDLEAYEPLILHPNDQSRVTVPHGLDRNVADALPALWYCLHLPRTFYDLINLHLSFMQSSWHPFKHSIVKRSASGRHGFFRRCF